MKRGTPEHPKMLDLAEAIYAHLQSKGLSLPLEACETLACGTIERLHHHAARYAPAGDIGKHSDARIAKAVGWDSDIEWIISQLITCRWIDKDVPGVRLFIHDWHVHSDDYADRYLADNGLRYANGAAPRNKPRKNSPAYARDPHAGGTHDARTPHAPHVLPESYSYSNPESNPPTSPTPSSSREQEEGEEVLLDAEDGWLGIERLLRDHGLVDSSAAIAAARKAGCSPQLAGMLIGHWEAHPKAWTIGLLYGRLMRLRPHDDPSKGWPEPSAEYKAAVERAKPKPPPGPSYPDQKAASRAEITTLERDYGPILDAMPRSDVDLIAAEVINGNLQLDRLYQRDGPKGLVMRERLLLHISKQRVSA